MAFLISMLKRISTQELTLGMFLHELCGSWMEHPFWRSQFLLKDANDLARIHKTSISEVWIDTSKGLDVAPHVQALTREAVDAAIETTFSQLADLPDFEVPPESFKPPTVRRSPSTTSMDEEVARAAQICRESKSAMVSMFNEARLGRALRVPNLQQLVEDISASIARNPDALISLVRLKKATITPTCIRWPCAHSWWRWAGRSSWAMRNCAPPAWPDCCTTWARRAFR